MSRAAKQSKDVVAADLTADRAAGSETVDVRPARLPYVSPRIEVIAHLDLNVLGGSPGNGDSGFEYIQAPRH